MRVLSAPSVPVPVLSEQMSDIRCQMSDIEYHMSNVECQMSWHINVNVKCHGISMSNVKCHGISMSNVKCQMFL